MIKHTTKISILCIALIQPASAQETSLPLPEKSSQEVSAPATVNAELKKLDPYRAVHEGNQLLLKGDAAQALDYYDHARKLKPDAREVDFVEGLGHYALQEYEDARQAFQRAAGGVNDALADDALYSLGTAYHAEALATKDDPQLALSHLESAMRQYHNVLANNPNHQAAKDANLKAATMWRNIKQILEQQQQQSDENKDSENKEKEDNENKEDQQKKDSENQDEQDNDKQQQDKESQDKNESDKKKDQDQKQQSSDSDKKEQDEKQQQAQAQQQEEVSREQAERKLREMMQALRDRKKAKRQQQQKIPFQPVDKDW